MSAVDQGGRELRGTDMAYVALLEGKREGREKSGWYLGMAVKGEPGYHQLKPGYGPYASKEEVEKHAEELNVKLGHTPLSALEVVLSSMRGPGSVLRHGRV